MNVNILIGAALLVLLGVLISKASDRFGVPALLLFLILGMLAGSEGLGGIEFADPVVAQFVSITALVLILFAGGLSTDWDDIRPVIKEGPLLATFGVLITALSLGLFARAVFGLSLLEGLLLGSIVSSTDAAAVFSVLRSKGISLKGQLKPLLELESGSNDPMAIFLTVGFIRLLTEPGLTPAALIGLFFSQMVIGAVAGYLMGRAILFAINRIRLGYEGLYPVFTLAAVLLTFGLTDRLGGSGFLAVYVGGVVLGHYEFVHKRSLTRFHDGIAWLMQITMFLTLGLFVFPSRLIPVAGASLLIAVCLMFVARPLSIFAGLAFSRIQVREKLFVSWVGLRGAAPIILATFPLVAGVPQAEMFFNVVFFIVLTSVLLQGTSIPAVARWLKVDAPTVPKRLYPLEYTPMEGLTSELKELPIVPGSWAAGKAIFEMGLPDDFLIMLVARDADFVVPYGGFVLQDGDVLLVLSERESFEQVKAQVEMRKDRVRG
jgi:potassium/hydrogen antiporter